MRIPPYGRSWSPEAFPGDTAVIPLNTYDMVLAFIAYLLGERRQRKGSRGFFAGAAGALTPVALTLMVWGGPSGCAPKLSAGEWECSGDAGASDGGTSTAPAVTDPVAIPWSTGFEQRFCGYTELAGYCYGDSAFTVVQSPHHKGRFSAQFSANATTSKLPQTRCVRRGVLPESAYYGAWYFIPEAPSQASVWNLFHFQGGDSPDNVRKFWDVTLVKDTPTAPWELIVYDPLAPANKGVYRSADHTPMPIGSWVHIVLFLKRAADASGQIALYQDDALLFQQTNLNSDASKFTEWYVGNYVTDAMPPDSTLYVDDVSISATQ